MRMYVRQFIVEALLYILSIDDIDKFRQFSRLCIIVILIRAYEYPLHVIAIHDFLSHTSPCQNLPGIYPHILLSHKMQFMNALCPRKACECMRTDIRRIDAINCGHKERIRAVTSLLTC